MRIFVTVVAIAALFPCAVDAEVVDHARIIRNLDDEAFKRGKATYDSFCFACHGKDGKTPTNPLARSFAQGEFKNGADPYSLWKTVTFGFNTMPATQASLDPRARYDVVHYIREAFLKKDNPKQYIKVDDAYLSKLKPTEEATRELNHGERDYGPVLGAQLQGPASADNALHFRLPNQVTYAWDTHTFRGVGLWTGGFLDLSQTQHYKQRGERMPKPNGDFVGGLQLMAWNLDGSFDVPGSKPDRGPVDTKLAEFLGHYVHGDSAVLSYKIAGRHVLETVGVDKSPALTAVHHTYHVAAGNKPLQLAVAHIENPSDRRVIDGKLAIVLGKAKKVSSRSEGGGGTGVARHQVTGSQAAKLDLGTPGRTTVVRFKTKGGGTLVSSAPEKGKWVRNGKTLFIKGGRAVYDIGWVGSITGNKKQRISNNQWHSVALVVEEDATLLYVDKRVHAERRGFREKHVKGHAFKIGATSTDFGGDFDGEISHVVVYDGVLDVDQIEKLHDDPTNCDEKKLFEWTPGNANAPVPAAVPVAKADPGADFAAAAVVGDTEGLEWNIDDAGRVVLTIPASNKPRVFRVIRSAGAGTEQLDRVSEYVKFSASNVKLTDPKDMTRGGPERWTEDMVVKGELGDAVNGYALDTIPVPFKNPYNAWMRTSAVDFFSDGRAAVCMHGGDVWIVSGIDGKLDKITWTRYAAGLFEPFGLKIVDDVVYVTTRDGIKRLHDYDNNGEADFIEAFHVDEDVSSMFHAYNFDLHTDSKGNFYFAKAGQYTHYAKPGTIMQVPPTGGPAKIVAHGIRTPNGMGALPGDRFTVSDNQGPWMPAGKVSLIVLGENRFFGNMPTNKSAKQQEAWLKSQHGGKLPTTYDEPFIWTPQDLDNSCGGQVWAGDKRWGPLAGRMIHSSFGKGWLYYLSLQEVDGKTQSSIVTLPHQWDAGVMRLRVNPTDGQVYGVGLSGWQGPRGGADGCFQRLRYAGGDVHMIEKTRVTPTGIELTFSFPLDRDTASRPDAYKAEMWDYKWSSKYGSDQFSVKNPGKKGHDKITIEKVELRGDGKTVHLVTPDLAVCDQLRIDLQLKGADGKAYKERVFFTIHGIPKKNIN